MAVTANAQVTGIFGFFEASSVGWVFSLTGDDQPDPVTRQLFYHLFLDDGGSGVELQDKQVTPGYIPVPAYVDFARIINARLTNNIPLALEDNEVRAVSTTGNAMEESYFIRYGEQWLNKDTGGIMAIISSDTDPFTVVKTGRDVDTADSVYSVMLPSTTTFLTAKPFKGGEIFSDSFDWIYLRTPEGSDMSLRCTLSRDAGAVTSDYITLTGDTLYRVPMGGGNLFGVSNNQGAFPGDLRDYLSDAHLLSIEFLRLSDGSQFLYDFRVRQTCGKPEFKEIYYREPAGSWSSIRFDKVDFLGSRASQVYDFQEVNSNTSPFGQGGSYGKMFFGTRPSKVDARPIYQLEKNLLRPTRQQRQFLLQLLAAKETFLRIKRDDGSTAFRRVEILDGEFPVALNQAKTVFSLKVRASQKSVSL
jgi:hypothetical protein